MTALLAIILSSLFALCSSQWIASIIPFPREARGMACGSFNGSIFLLGGTYTPTPARRQLVEYSVPPVDQFIDHTALLYDVFGNSEFYTQIGSILYLISSAGSTIHVYDMSNKMFTPNVVSIPTSVNWYGCIASIHDRLFVVGGGDPDAHLSFNYLQVLELKYMNWIDGPTMARKRVRHSCVADTFGLFAIGGYDYESSSPWLTSIETIDINNTTQNSWEIIHNLEESNVVASSVVHNHLIYVMGGRTCSPQPCTFYDTVYIIDTKTKSVTLSNDRLPYDAFEIASTILGGFIYIFGGGNGAGSTPVNEWAYYELPSLSPT
eukprot:192127_1